MRAKCSVYGCKSATYNKIGYVLNFHRFPKDPGRLKKWKELCKNPRIMNKHHTQIWMCSLHFENKCYANEHLRYDAIPTLKLPEAGFSFYSNKCNNEQASNQTETDSNDCSSPIAASDDADNSSEVKRSPKLEAVAIEEEAGVIEEEAQENELVIKDESRTTIDEDDDCESVNFSSSEDEEPDAKLLDFGLAYSNTKTVNDHGDVQDLTGPDLNNDSPPGTFTDFPSHEPAEPVYTSLPIISGVSTIAENPPDTQTTGQSSTSRVLEVSLSSVIDKVVEDNIENTDEEDDCSTFAAHVKTRMRNFNPTQKAIAQKLISDILFLADTEQLQLASAIVNPKSQVVNNVEVKKSLGESFSTYVVDSDEDDFPLVKKKK